jgi:50S ribosomal subunit-associated GTPase HflX
MSFQAYLDNIEKQTGVTPAEFERLARARGYSPATKATEVTDWLKADYGLGHGHAMAIVKLLKECGVLK